MKTVYALLFVTIISLTVQTHAATNKLRLKLPPSVYAVPGQEMNIYFDNIILAANYNIYAFDVNCVKGRQDKNRWRFTAKPEEVGRYPWKIKVFDSSNEVVAEGQTEIIVSPADAGSGKTISLLLIGDSLTDASVYPSELYELFRKPGNPAVVFIGSHSGHGKAPGNFAHEGYSGWRWDTFLTKYASAQNDYRGKSKFLIDKNGTSELDFKAYCNQYAGGKIPDFITIMLGTNDVFGAKEDNLESAVDQILKNAEKLIAEFQRVAPDAQIGLALTVPPAASQDAFGASEPSQSRWQYRRNQHRLVERMIEKYGNGQYRNISLVPAYLNLDCENNFPVTSEPVNSRNNVKVLRQNNGVHPAPEGYLQIADSFYAWLKFKLSDKK